MPSQWVDVPLTGPAYQNLDEVELTTFSPVVRNAFINEANFTIGRPGLEEFIDLGTNAPVDAVFWWEKQKIALAVSGGDVWKITDFNGTMTKLTTTDQLISGQQVSIDADATDAYLANGGQILSTDTTGPAAFLADADAPTACTHLAFLDQYLLFNIANSGSWGFSEVGQPKVIRAVDIFTAETKPDDLVGLHVGLGEIMLPGSDSVEFWRNDATSPFSRLEGTTLERGVSAPDSVKFVKNRWMFLDSNRFVVEVSQRVPEEVSLPFDKVIQKFSRVDDAKAHVMTIEGLPLYVLTFPSEQRTLVYNFQKKDWSEWDFWDSEEATERRFRGNAYAFAKDWNFHLVGDFANGKIYKASSDVFQDDGQIIRRRRRTGNVTHGTYERKASHELRLRMKRGVANSAIADPQVMVRWRDHRGAWSNEHWRSLGKEGEHDMFVRFTQLGSYEARQYEITMTDPAAFILTEAKERIEVLL